MTNLPRYETCVAYYLFFVYSSLSHISFIFSFSNSSLPPAPLSHTLSSSLSPFALFSSHSRIWATTDFLSTITNLICPFTEFFFPPFVRSLLSVLSQSRLSGCRFVTSDCDRHGSLGCGYLLSVLSWVVDSLFVVLRASICYSISEGFIDSPWAKLVSSIRSTSTAYG